MLQSQERTRKKEKYFLTNPVMQSRLPLLPLLLLQQPRILPASVFILILSASLSLADSAHYDQISNYLLSPRQDCGDSLFCGAPDVWGTLGGWFNEIQNNNSPAALPMPLDDGKTETLPPVPDPELRRNKQAPKNVLDYLQLMSYKRYAAQESVWIGFEGLDSRKGYSNWIGVPRPK